MQSLYITSSTGNLPTDSLMLGGALGIWEIARNKIIHIPIYIIYSKHAKDPDLKKFLLARINTISKQIETIQKLFTQKGFNPPMEFQWEKKLKDESPVMIPETIMNDEEIIMAIREHIRSSLVLEAEALGNATIDNTRDLVYEILRKDNKSYSEALDLQKMKGWIDFPPQVIQQ